MENQSNKKVKTFFIATNPYLETHVVSPVEKLVTSKNLVSWGDRNKYPDYLLSLYQKVTTLNTIINGNIDYIVGDDVTISQTLHENLELGVLNMRGDTVRYIVRAMARDYEIYGGYALQIIRDLSGAVCEVYALDMRFVRCNPDCTVFYYSKKWGEGGKTEVVTYPKFMANLNWGGLEEEEKKRHLSSVLFVKTVDTQVYPMPMYAAAVKACEMEANVDDYHLNALENGFMASVIVNFNNGDPEPEEKEEIERMIEEKFCGHSNAERVMCSWNDSKANAVTIEKLDTVDFGEKYKALASHSRQQIFTAFRAIPLLFGLTSDVSTGFSTDEFEQSFKLYNRTQIRPVQRLIADTFDKIFGQKGVLAIVPFSLSSDTEANVN